MSVDLLRQQPRWKEALVSLREMMTSLVQQVQFLTHERSSQLCTQLKQMRKERLKKFQALTGFEPMTSAIPLQCPYSTN